MSDGVYANPPFEGGVDARAVLEASLSEAAVADREQVVAAIAAGESREEAVASLNTDERFEAWLASFTDDLTATLGVRG